MTIVSMMTITTIMTTKRITHCGILVVVVCFSQIHKRKINVRKK